MFFKFVDMLLLLFQTSIVEWRLVFISGAVVLFISNLFFIIFGSGKTQPWNSLKSNGKVSLISN